MEVESVITTVIKKEEQKNKQPNKSKIIRKKKKLKSILSCNFLPLTKCPPPFFLFYDPPSFIPFPTKNLRRKKKISTAMFCFPLPSFSFTDFISSSSNGAIWNKSEERRKLGAVQFVFVNLTMNFPLEFFRLCGSYLFRNWCDFFYYYFFLFRFCLLQINVQWMPSNA